ncbi:MAG: septal ring lytic transglycosylase RlpA family protein [Desulfobacterales bacterium]
MPFDKEKKLIHILLAVGYLFFGSCSAIKTTYNVTKGAVKTTYNVTEKTVKTTYKVTKGTVKATYKVTRFAGKTVYQIGKYSFVVVMAPLNWPLMHEDIDSIDDLPPKEAIRQGRVKASPYVVKGKRYVPMSVKEAGKYRQKGTASWYGYETLHQKGGHMTANGEAFDPNGLNAAHKYLPLPTYVRVTNLENHRNIIVRVNDRGPFVQGRIIDLSAGAAKKLGFYKKGTARVLVETIQLEG